MDTTVISANGEDNRVCRQERLRVLLVFERGPLRTMMTQMLQEHPDIEVAGAVSSAEMATRSASRMSLDVVILDAELPVMQALIVLPQLLGADEKTKVLVCTGASTRGTEMAVCALVQGAADCIVKPFDEADVEARAQFRTDLVRRVRQLGGFSVAAPVYEVAANDQTVETFHDRGPIRRWHISVTPPKIVAIGGSTGAMAPLVETLKRLRDIPVPILVSYPLPPGFGAYTAECLEKKSGVPVFVAEDGMKLKKGCAYIAPGGCLMSVQRSRRGATLRLEMAPPRVLEGAATDTLLRSLLPVYGARVLAVMLSGAGNDGHAGCHEIVAQGGRVIAQDGRCALAAEMPRAVAAAALCSAILPPRDIAPWIWDCIRGTIPLVDFCKMTGAV